MKVSKLVPALTEKIEREERESGADTICPLCALHELFEEKYKEIISERAFESDSVIIPLCPKCDRPLEIGTKYGYTDAVVGGSNTVDEDEDMQYCQCWHCDECDQDYAMMPEEITWNANHDVLYTGGKHYLSDEDEALLISKIREKMSASVEQFVRRVKDPKDVIDHTLTDWHLNLWLERNITGAVSEFLYEKGFKK